MYKFFAGTDLNDLNVEVLHRSRNNKLVTKLKGVLEVPETRTTCTTAFHRFKTFIWERFLVLKRTIFCCPNKDSILYLKDKYWLKLFKGFLWEDLWVLKGRL